MAHRRAHRAAGPRRGGSRPATNGVAFSTGQAARYCFVTADTILNWINGGALRAQRTAGGQYRILALELLAFMREHGMSTELLVSEIDVRPHCWEFHCEGEPSSTCLQCIVHLSGAINCFALCEVAPGGRRLVETCDSCDYHRLYGGSSEEE